MAESHPAYADPSYPTNQLFGYIQTESARALWAEPTALAGAMFEIVNRGKQIPIRVPLGADAWSMISKDVEDTKKELEELRDISLSVGDAK